MKISNLLEHLQPGLQIAPYLSTDTQTVSADRGRTTPKSSPLEPSPLILPLKSMQTHATWIIHQNMDQT